MTEEIWILGRTKKKTIPESETNSIRKKTSTFGKYLFIEVLTHAPYKNKADISL